MHEHISSQTLLMQQSDSCSLCTWNGSKHIWLYESERESRSVMSNPLQPMDYTVHGILQAVILEWVAVPSSRGSSQPRDWTQVPCIAGGFFTNWATREPPLPYTSCIPNSVLTFTSRSPAGTAGTRNGLRKQKVRNGVWKLDHLLSCWQ